MHHDVYGYVPARYTNMLLGFFLFYCIRFRKIMHVVQGSLFFNLRFLSEFEF